MEKNLVRNRNGQIVERREWLKDLRKEKGLTVRKTAEELNISFTFYSDIENNRRSPSLEKAVQIARYFGFSAEKFIS